MNMVTSETSLPVVLILEFVYVSPNVQILAAFVENMAYHRYVATDIRDGRTLCRLSVVYN